ncbi:DNA replication licensing factor mcm8 [Rhizophlyctis rosea]|nr:DNA replication licensing factor mcm8 [Rhizophlyctis rosea]
MAEEDNHRQKGRGREDSGYSSAADHSRQKFASSERPSKSENVHSKSGGFRANPKRSLSAPLELGEAISLKVADRIIMYVDYAHFKSNAKVDHFEESFQTNSVQVLSCLGLAAHEAYRQRLPALKKDHLQVIARIANFTNITLLKDLKGNLSGRFIGIRGTVVRVSSVKPIVRQLSFVCNICGARQTLSFADGKYHQPSKCTTYGCKGKAFSPSREPEDEHRTVDWQRIRIQEKLPESQLDAGRVPRTVECELTDDLVDTVVPGDVVYLMGSVKVLATEEGKGKANAQMFYLYIDANSITKASGGSSDPGAFDKDFIDLSQKDLFGIRQIIRGDDNRTEVNIRSDPHILVVGDPGLGKSQMLTATVRVAPRGVYVCGNTATTSGLTVTMCKDSETGDTALEAGALVLGDRGVCCIDEFDKMTEHQALLEAMEQQSVSIAKSGVVCNLPARTSVIAAANPVGGHYNKAKTVAENLKMGSALLSRFDLVFILLDRPNEEMDTFLSEHIMKLHAGTLKQEDKDSIKKHVFARHGVGESDGDDVRQPLSERLNLSREAAHVLQRFYMTLRSKYRSVDATPITTRQLESMIRLAEARARAVLRETVTEQDAEDVVEIMKFSLWDTYQDEMGNLDFQRSQNGSGMSKKGEPKRFVAELHKLAQNSGNARFTYENLYTLAQEMRLNYDNFQDFVESLNNQGYLLKKGNRIYQLSTAG